MEIQAYIAQQLVDTLVQSGTDVYAAQRQVNDAVIGRHSTKRVTAKDSFGGISVNRLAEARQIVEDYTSELGNEQVDKTAVYEHTLEKISSLNNKYEWLVRRASFSGLLTLFATILIAICFSFDYYFSYLSLGSVFQHDILPIAVLSAIVGALLWLVDSVLPGTILPNLLLSFLLTLIAKILTSVYANQVVYSVLWGSLVILVAGIKFVHGTYDYLSGSHTQASKELFSALLVFAGLALGLWLAKVHGLEIEDPGKPKGQPEFVYIVKGLANSLGSVAFYFLFSAAVSVNMHKQKEWYKLIPVVMVFSFFVYLSFTVFQTLIEHAIKAMLPVEDETGIKDVSVIISTLLVSGIFFHICQSHIRQRYPYWPVSVLYIPTIVLLIPGCSLCQGFIGAGKSISVIMAIVLPLYFILSREKQDDEEQDDEENENTKQVNAVQGKTADITEEDTGERKKLFHFEYFIGRRLSQKRRNLEYFRIVREYLQYADTKDNKAFYLAAKKLIDRSVQGTELLFIKSLANVLCAMKDNDSYCPNGSNVLDDLRRNYEGLAERYRQKLVEVMGETYSSVDSFMKGQMETGQNAEVGKASYDVMSTFLCVAINVSMRSRDVK